MRRFGGRPRTTMLLCIAVAAALFFYQQTSYVSDRRQLDVSGRPPSVRASRTAQPRIRPPVGPRTSGVNSASVDVSGPFDALEPPQLSLSPPVSGVELPGRARNCSWVSTAEQDSWRPAAVASRYLVGWHGGFSDEHLWRAWADLPADSGCVLVSVLSHRVYTRDLRRTEHRDERRDAVRDSVLEILAYSAQREDFPDAELILCADWCPRGKTQFSTRVPIFTAVQCRPDFVPLPALPVKLSEWKTRFREQWDGAAPWRSRVDRAGFAGNVDSCTPLMPREPANLRNCGPLNLLQATSGRQFSLPVDVEVEHASLHLSGLHAGQLQDDLSRYRFVISAEPDCRPALHLPQHMLLGAALVKPVASCDAWFEPSLRAYVHYLPTRADYSDLDGAFEWADTHPRDTEAVACRMHEFAGAVLSVEGIVEYVTILIRQYQQLASHNVQWRYELVPFDSGPLAIAQQPDQHTGLVPAPAASATTVSLDPAVDVFFDRMPVFISHYAKLTQRRQHVHAMLVEAGFEDHPQAIRWRTTVNADALNENVVKEYYNPDRKRFVEISKYNLLPPDIYWKLSPAYLANWLEQIGIWREIVAEQLPFALIVEDDAIPTELFRERLHSTMRQLPAGWGFAFIGQMFTDVPRFKLALRDGVHVYPQQNTRTTEAYVISLEAARKTLDMVPPFTGPIDWELIYVMIKQNLPGYFVWPPLVKQGSLCHWPSVARPMVPCMEGSTQLHRFTADVYAGFEQLVVAPPSAPCEDTHDVGDGWPLCQDGAWRLTPASQRCLLYSVTVDSDDDFQPHLMLPSAACRVVSVGNNAKRESFAELPDHVLLSGWDDMRPGVQPVMTLRRLLRATRLEDGPIDWFHADLQGHEWHVFEQLHRDGARILQRIGQVCVTLHFSRQQLFTLERLRTMLTVMREANFTVFHRAPEQSATPLSPDLARHLQQRSLAPLESSAWRVCWRRPLNRAVTQHSVRTLTQFLTGELPYACKAHSAVLGADWMMFCGDNWLKTSGCLVYALGSMSEEDTALGEAHPNCDVHIWDGRGRQQPDKPAGNVFVHRTSLGGHDAASGRVARLSTLKRMADQEHKTVDWLKLDCAGCEWLAAEQLHAEGSAVLDTVNQFCATLHVDASLHFSLARWDAFRTVFLEQHEFAAFYRAPLRTSPMMRHVAPQELVQQLGDKNWLQCGGGDEMALYRHWASFETRSWQNPLSDWRWVPYLDLRSRRLPGNPLDI